MDKGPATAARGELIDPGVVVLASMAIIGHGKVLMVKEEAEPYHGKWVLPQGYTKPRETLEQAAKREVGEELGSQIEILRLLGVYEDLGESGRHYIIVCYLCRLASHQEIRASPEVIDWAWTDPTNSDDDIPVVFQEILRDISALRGRFLSLVRSRRQKASNLAPF